MKPPSLICCLPILSILVVTGMSLSLHAREKDKPVPAQFRAVLHDPVHPAANLFYTDETGAIVELNFRPKVLSETLYTLLANGSLVLYYKASIDPLNPVASVAASAKIPPDTRRAIVDTNRSTAPLEIFGIIPIIGRAESAYSVA